MKYQNHSLKVANKSTLLKMILLWDTSDLRLTHMIQVYAHLLLVSIILSNMKYLVSIALMDTIW